MELDSLGLYDIYGLNHVPFWQTTWFWYCLLGLGLTIVLGLAVCTMYIIMRRMTRSHQTPWDKALCNLASLKQRFAMSDDVSEYYYDAFSTIIKEYLAERFNIDCAGKTDDEICAILKQQTLIHSSQKLSFVLRRGIDAKFAQTPIQHVYLDEDYESIAAFVLSTIPQSKKTV